MTAQKCGCGGEIKKGVGCLDYLDSDAHDQDSQHEDMMRARGLGFGIQRNSFDAMMSMHIQANGLEYNEALAILQKE